MRLTDLNPRWIGAGGPGIFDKDGNQPPERFGVGVTFECPCGCPQRCYIPFTEPLDGGPKLEIRHPTWECTGSTFEDLTLSPSIQRVGGCAWHGWVKNGEVTAV